MFKLPSGQCSKAFDRECTHLMLEYAEDSSLECIALMALMLMPCEFGSDIASKEGRLQAAGVSSSVCKIVSFALRRVSSILGSRIN